MVGSSQRAKAAGPESTGQVEEVIANCRRAHATGQQYGFDTRLGLPLCRLQVGAKRLLFGDQFEIANVADGSRVPLRRRGLTAVNLTFEGTSELTVVTAAERPQADTHERPFGVAWRVPYVASLLSRPNSCTFVGHAAAARGYGQG